MFTALLKISQNCKEINCEFLLQFFFEIFSICTNKNSLKNLIRIYLGNPAKNSLIFLKKLNESLKEKCQKEVFGFLENKKSGIILEDIKFPNDGYGFFCWLRVDKFTSDGDTSCIWKFKTPIQFSFPLYLDNKCLVYSIENLKENNLKIAKKLSGELMLNTWYFIEFYHTKDTANDNMVLFLINIAIIYRRCTFEYI